MGDAEQLVTELRRSNPNVWAIAADLRRPACADLIEHASNAFGGPPSVLVNSASVFDYDTPQAVDPNVLDHAMAVNLRAPVLLTERFAMLADPEADNCVVNLLDMKLWNLNPDFYSYTLSKAALLAATEIGARAYAPKVRVNAIAPALLLPSYDQTQEEYVRVAQVNLMQRPVDMEDVVSSLEFLIANQSLTGQVIHVDNGRRLIAAPRDVMFLTRPQP
jgi:NAD(P)-dependent dehydrogenase (short-subunit alcohol dehydrogenase family)